MGDHDTRPRLAHLLTLPAPMGELPAPIERTLRDADAVLALAVHYPGKAEAEHRLGRPIRDVTDLIPIDSPEEHAVFERARLEAGLITAALGDVTVTGLPLGFAVSTALHAGIQREMMLALCLARLGREGVRTLAVLGDPRTVEGAAFVRRMHATGAWRLTGWTQVRDGAVTRAVSPVPLGTPAELAAPLADPTLLGRPIRVRRWRGEVLEGGQEIQAGAVLFVVGTSTALSSVHTEPVARACTEAGTPVAILAVDPADPAPLRDSFGEGRVLSARTELDEASAEARDNAFHAVRARLAALYTHAGGLQCWVPLETARAERRLRAVTDRAVRIAAACAAAVERVAPRSVWLSDTVSPADAFVAQAASGVPVVTGFAALVAENLRCLPLVHPGLHYAVNGEQEEDILRARGCDPERQIHAVGSPRYDHLYTIDVPARRDAVRGELGIAPDARVAVVMTSRLDDELEDAWLVPLCEWAHERGATVLIKPHPSRVPRYARVRTILDGKGLSSVVWSSHPAIDALCAADVLITDKSSVTVEAAVLGRPIVQMNPGEDRFDYNDFAGEGVAIEARTTDELCARLGGLLDGGGDAQAFEAARETFLRRYVHGNDGRASQRAATLLSDPPPSLGGVLDPYLEYAFPPSMATTEGVTIPGIA